MSDATSPSQEPPEAPASPPGPGGGTDTARAYRRPRRAAAITAAVLFAAVAVIIALTTPWTPLPGHVPGGRVRPDPAPDFTPAEIHRAAAFDHALNWPAYARLFTVLAVVLVLGFTPLGARLLGLLTARTRRWPLRVLIGALAFTSLTWALSMPFAAWGESILRDYGLSTQSWPSWLVDQVKSLAVTWVTYTLGLLLLVGLIRRFPRYWWTGAAAGACALVIAGSFAYPVMIEPVFNTFHSLPAGQLRTDLLDMARRDGVPVSDVLVADASRRTTSLNAYVSGFGSTRRIVVYDTLLTSMSTPRIESIVAHELGHAKSGDVLHGTLIGALGAAGGLCLLYLLLTSPRLLRRAGLTAPAARRPDKDEAARDPSARNRGAADPRALALVLALIAVATQLEAPVQNLVSRHVEARADAHALNLTRDPATFATMQHELSVRNISTLTPDVLETQLWSDHPTGPERIAMARDWARMHHVPEPPPLVRH
ncbi:M48 family metallopeptidase [Actinomadura harenae]|uniref:M48 family peptidase n=1 Tax=Actinomadura harenae TaxID=2483351 RepID=A0A3M2L612_9ACTN|nr:M48 family metallopeptidase [Actinomadura harenae]RMI33142.1 M48 family peptidase [Actinomadura harenae]